MAKDFKGGMDSLLGGVSGKGKAKPVAVAKELKGVGKSDEKDSPKRGRPKTNFKAVTKTSQAGTKENETRATFIVNEDHLESLKALAYWERRSIKEVLAQALTDYLDANRKDLNKATELYRGKRSA